MFNDAVVFKNLDQIFSKIVLYGSSNSVIQLTNETLKTIKPEPFFPSYKFVIDLDKYIDNKEFKLG